MSKEETTREVAERQVREWVEHGLDELYEDGIEFPVVMPPEDLIERIDRALVERDERAARIADDHYENDDDCRGDEHCGKRIAIAIREQEQTTDADNYN